MGYCCTTSSGLILLSAGFMDFSEAHGFMYTSVTTVLPYITTVSGEIVKYATKFRLLNPQQ